jgi:hypothetical protein
MIRFWFEFDFNEYENEIPPGLFRGCGNTAYNQDQAISFLQNRVFKDVDLPRISKCIENVDIRLLDQGHVIPNMKVPLYIGIWFPLGYE